jgi:hypothetical protein
MLLDCLQGTSKGIIFGFVKIMQRPRQYMDKKNPAGAGFAEAINRT